LSKKRRAEALERYEKTREASPNSGSWRATIVGRGLPCLFISFEGGHSQLWFVAGYHSRRQSSHLAQDSLAQRTGDFSATSN
jgi:hypothetical protein